MVELGYGTKVAEGARGDHSITIGSARISLPESKVANY